MEAELLVVKTPPKQREMTHKQLLHAIARKRKTLMLLTAKVEMLRIELELVKHEYNVRVGRLYIDDNQLDLEIIKYKKMIELVRGGHSIHEAEASSKESFGWQEDAMDEQKKQIHEEEILLKNRKIVPEDLAQEIKKLWKKVLFTFHPDLVTDPVEKKRREEIMVKINKAYEEQNIEALRAIDRMQLFDDLEVQAEEKLEEILIGLENSILSASAELRVLKESEWYTWKIAIDRARRYKKDVFVDLEQKIREDIKKKMEILGQLKRKVARREFY